MDVNCDEGCPIKSEVILTETFSFCEELKGYGDKEFKSEPVNTEESLKCKEEENLADHMDIYADTVQQYTCNYCNFRTTEKIV
ncbi:hypothetical protein FQA39_LY08992 [Lamprigera yunnana]|nr:hypothetical protein FQA39_LY08992 [Lamprigera yunnana]